MQLLPGNEDRYLQRHNPIWPELERVLKAHGVSNYSIFLERETGKLFGYAEIADEARWNVNRRDRRVSSLVGIDERPHGDQ